MDDLIFNYNPKKRGSKKKCFFLIIGFVVFGYFIFNTSLLSKEFEIKNKLGEINNKFETTWIKRFTALLFFNQNHAEEIDRNYIMPEKEDGRIDILVLGIRGEDDKDADIGGYLLTDTMMVFSHDRLTKKSSLVSLPRDFYVKMGDKNKKLNEAYEYGLLRKEGTDYIKKLISQITGIYIDNVIVIDFSSFKKLVDQLGGVDIVLAKPFKEPAQWGYEFELPIGENHLDGQAALYYVRSRYSTTDFDRSFRQQQVILAIKNKATKLNIITDPIKTLSVISTLSQNIKTDINIWNIKEIIDLAKEIDTSPSVFKKQVLSTDNLLYQGKGPEGTYILLPQGKNFDLIKQMFQDILK